jgi:hypothetical protein
MVVAAPIGACASELPEAAAPAGEADEPKAVSTTAMASKLVAGGFTVQDGKCAFLDMTACCDSSCAGNNPTSPYGAFYVPPAPGAPPEPEADPAGLSTSFKLRADEAVVFVGQTPPEARYFGFTPYLTDRATDSGGRRIVAASLSETLNNLVIRVAGRAGAPVFGKQTAIVAAADASTRKNAVDALVAAGVPLTSINVMVFDPAPSRFGLDASGDRFSVLFRVALPADAAALQAWMVSPGASVYRLTPNAQAPANPLPSPSARPKDRTNTETALTPAVDRLRAAIVAAYPGYAASDVNVDDGVSDPQSCIDGTGVCAFDNRDTTYPSTRPGVLFSADEDFYVAYGVDHQVANKVSYANVSVYAIEHLVGLKGVASPSYPGSAQKFLGAGDADAPKLFAWKIARSCNETACMAIPKGACPTGIDNGALGAIGFRTYLEPSSKTAPLPATLVRDRILRFRKN